MKLLLFSFFTFILIAFSSCIEIIDDLSFNEDGSGTFNYTVNLSSSKVKINSILALDSLDGKKVPSIDDITKKLSNLVEDLKQKEGINSVDFQSDYTNFIFKLSCNFSNLERLQTAIKELAIKENKGREVPELHHQWLRYENDTLVRSIPQITIAKTKKLSKKDSDLLKEGHYTSITRFAKEIVACSNDSARLSKNKKAVMIRSNPYLLTQNPQLLDNSIFLTKSMEE